MSGARGSGCGGRGRGEWNRGVCRRRCRVVVAVTSPLHRCVRYSGIAALLGWTWSAWAQEAAGTPIAAGAGVGDLLIGLGMSPAMAGPAASLGLPGLLVYLAWRVGKAGGITGQVRIPDDQLARLVAALRDESADLDRAPTLDPPRRDRADPEVAP